MSDFILTGMLSVVQEVLHFYLPMLYCVYIGILSKFDNRPKTVGLLDCWIDPLSGDNPVPGMPS